MAISDNDDLVWSLNLMNGVVARIPRHVFEHPTFSEHQVEVAPFSESFEKWKPQTKDEYLASHQETEIATPPDTDPKHPGDPKDESAGTSPSPRSAKHAE